MPDASAPRSDGDGARVDASLAAFVARHGLPSDGARVIVGCSGGADSTALALALARRPVSLHLVYVDHGLRPGTDAEAAFVASLAASLHATSECARVEVDRRGNLLARAREARYAALARIARSNGARLVAVGHTATDQAETVAFRKARDDVPHALAGMPAVRLLDGEILLLRPLLDASRADTAARAFAAGLTPVEDPSNAIARFTRVRIRRALADDPAATRDLLETAALAATDLARDEALAAALGDPSNLPIAPLTAAGEGVLLRLLRRSGSLHAGRVHVRALRALASSSAGTRRLDLPDGIRAIRTYDRLALTRRDETPVDEICLPMTIPGSYSLLDQTIDIAPAPPGTRDALDPARLPPSLFLRNLRPGDRFATPAGRRKLQDILVDRKVPRDARRRLPLLAASELAGDILFIPGIGPAHGLRAAHDLPGVQLFSRSEAPLPTEK